jgi:hypothetical protein
MTIGDKSKNRLGYTELKTKDVDEYTASEIYVKQVLERIQKGNREFILPSVIIDLK